MLLWGRVAGGVWGIFDYFHISPGARVWGDEGTVGGAGAGGLWLVFAVLPSKMGGPLWGRMVRGGLLGAGCYCFVILFCIIGRMRHRNGGIGSLQSAKKL